ncbi:Protein of unknown function [Paracoccus thiocyanatus]|uniref:Glycosyltransferase 61 catalytic domain-containing protein n=1 Tax=Paracoccus thiocyanatus TaxID=34006 RepID=A0A1N6NTP8_9RHOB|nr:glycosyltransferase family 61 protein [Paracoccus thiocyanatus]SIP95352.1 Protein of unknown function [Paracoccus thiocyanatus]
MEQQSPLWAGPPDEYFFVVGRDPGLWFVEPPEWLVRPVPGARVRQYACSDYANVQEVIEKNLEPRWQETQPLVLETNTLPVIGKDVTFRGGGAQVQDRFLPNGASGDRSFSRYLKHNPGLRPFRQTNRFFAAARQETTMDLPIWPLESGRIPIGIECRNRTNFYHFMTESLPLLVHYVDSQAERITFHCRNDDPSGFSDRFIRAVFPEIHDRVSFTARATSYERVNIPLNLRHMIYANGDPRIQQPIESAQGDPEWQTVSAHVQRRKFILKNTYDASLRLLRERALSKISQADLDKMPKRIWISRDDRNANVNQRPLVGEEKLVARLRDLGFEQMFFERMEPLEQIAAVHAAEVIGAAHGAFFGNMIFANPNAHVIEVGSVQTQFHRWGDFLGNAHASGCRYSVVFADTAQDDPSEISSIKQGLIGVRIGDKAIDLICRLAEQGQFD